MVVISIGLINESESVMTYNHFDKTFKDYQHQEYEPSFLNPNYTLNATAQVWFCLIWYFEPKRIRNKKLSKSVVVTAANVGTYVICRQWY